MSSFLPFLNWSYFTYLKDFWKFTFSHTCVIKITDDTCVIKITVRTALTREIGMSLDLPFSSSDIIFKVSSGVHSSKKNDVSEP